MKDATRGHGFTLQYIELVVVAELELAKVAELTLSELAGSHAKLGGLNMVLSGAGTRTPADTFPEACSLLQKQNILLPKLGAMLKGEDPEPRHSTHDDIPPSRSTMKSHPDNVNGDLDWEVKKIRDSKISNGNLLYRIDWGDLIEFFSRVYRLQVHPGP